MRSLATFGSNSGLQISFKDNIDQVTQELRDVDRWAIPYITAAALTDTAISARKAEQKGLSSYFSAPTPYVKRGVLWKNATRKELVSRVYINTEPTPGTPQARILRPNVDGGPRRAKPFEHRLRRAGIMRDGEYAVRGAGAKLDRYGNIGGGNIERMLSQLQAAEQFAGYKANETARSRRRNRGRSKSRYFVADGSGALRRGIWERYGRRIRPFLIFVSGAPNYQRRYPFGEEARDVAAAEFGRHWAKRFRSFVVKGKILKGSGGFG